MCAMHTCIQQCKSLPCVSVPCVSVPCGSLKVLICQPMYLLSLLGFVHKRNMLICFCVRATRLVPHGMCDGLMDATGAFESEQRGRNGVGQERTDEGDRGIVGMEFLTL